VQGVLAGRPRKRFASLTARKPAGSPRGSAPKRGAPVTRIEYVTSKAKVVLTFRKQSVAAEDILAALDEARLKADPEKRTLNIERLR
jgi:hypothetical protein